MLHASSKKFAFKFVTILLLNVVVFLEVKELTLATKKILTFYTRRA